MKLPGFLEFLRGANGGIELNRLVGALGALSYVVGANGFTAWNLIQGREFDVTAYCLAFPGGLSVLGLGTAGAVALKDRQVALAHATESKTKTDEAAAHADAGTSTDEAADAAEETAEAAVDKADEIKGKRRG